MSLLAQLQGEIRLYLEGERSLDQLQDWLGAAVLPIAHAGEAEADRLAARVWRLISEHSAGHHTVESLQEELRVALGDLQPLATLNVTQWQLPEPRLLVTGTASQLQTVDPWAIGQPYDVPRTYHAPRVTVG